MFNSSLVYEFFVMKPYAEKVQEFIDSLPEWVTVKTDINKTALKANLLNDVADHPDGACIIENKSLRIR